MNLVVNLLRSLNMVPVPLVDTQSQMARARAILEANNFGVFHEIEKAEGGLTADETAAAVDISTSGAAVLLGALASAGYLRERGGRYTNGPWVKRWIVHPTLGVANYLKLQMHVWSRLETLTEVLKTGRPADDLHQQLVATASAEQEIYTLAMRELARLLLPQFLKRIEFPRGATRFLDLGGAHGEYARALQRRYPGLKATVMDLAGPVATAKKLLAAEGEADRLEFLAGDILQDDWGDGWDAILMSNMVHLFDPEQNVKLLRRVHASLASGGTLFVLDQVTGLGRYRDLAPALISINLFTMGGRCYPLTQMQQILREAGFARLKAKPFVPWRASCLIQAWKA